MRWINGASFEDSLGFTWNCWIAAGYTPAIKTEDITKINIEIVFALAKLVETRDHDTGVHTENVVQYCEIITEGIDDEEFIAIGTTKEIFVSVIKVASVLHDIGKVGISDTILNKKGKLDEFEFELMKTHTLIGSDILEKIQKNYPHNAFINMGLDVVAYSKVQKITKINLNFLIDIFIVF